MNLKSLIFGLCVLVCFTACDEETNTLGVTLTNNMDHLEISTDTFTITTRSIIADSVLARSASSYLGTIRDPETGEYISANYMTQFHTLEQYGFPVLDSISSRDNNGDIIADSCELRLFWDDFYGDSLTSMKCTAYELAKPMTEDKTYYSNFDPIAEGFIRDAAKGGIRVNKTYSLEDMDVDPSIRNNNNYTKNIRILLNQPYTDKEGKTYNNFGTYIMRKYYKEYGGDSTYFKNSIRLTNNVIPGFYIKSSGGLGNLVDIKLTQLNVYFRYRGSSSSSAYTGTTSFAGTQEVMQHTTYVNEKGKIQELANDPTCTYMKTPAGIFTEVTLPVDEICLNHENDTINSAKFTLQRLNEQTNSKYAFNVPTTVLMIPKDSLYSFFEKKKIINNKISFISTFNSKNNTYTFNNIGSMINAMQHSKQNGNNSENWNKAVLIPVVTSTNTSDQINKVVHDMSLTCTKLVGGKNNPNGDIKISVIYSKYK
jgi:hypothetical protein